MRLRQQEQGQRQSGRRSVGFVVFGGVLVAAAAGLWYALAQTNTVESITPDAYSYKTTQSVDTSIAYFQNSFFAHGPETSDTAYVSDLTDTITATFHYRYQATRPAALSTTYSVVVKVRQNYVAGADGKDISSVWSKEYPLVAPVTRAATTDQVEFSPTVTIPFSVYRKQADQLKTSLALPVTAEATVTFLARVSGTIDDTPFDEVKTATITLPLDQPVYKLATKFEKEDSKQVIASAVKSGQDMVTVYAKIGAGLLGIAGIVSIVYGMRRQIFKSPYQRELDRIYRYHDGLIIKASAQTNITGKTIVPVQSFDDILNLEEEIKAPIVSSPVGGEATRFMIIHGDIVYVYTLGKIVKEEAKTGRSIEEIEAFIEGHQSAVDKPTSATKAKSAHPRARPKGRI